MAGPVVGAGWPRPCSGARGACAVGCRLTRGRDGLGTEEGHATRAPPRGEAELARTLAAWPYSPYVSASGEAERTEGAGRFN